MTRGQEIENIFKDSFFNKQVTKHEKHHLKEGIEILEKYKNNPTRNLGSDSVSAGKIETYINLGLTVKEAKKLRGFNWWVEYGSLMTWEVFY